jgi:arginyl-tRNA synthetase
MHEEITAAILESCGKLKHTVSEEQIAESIAPAKEGFGDVTSTIAFQIAKVQKINPAAVAKSIKDKIKLTKELEACEVAGPYLNFTYSDSFFSGFLQDADAGKPARSKYGRGKEIVVEFSSPNIGKPFHIGHIRSTVLGASVVRILQSTGFKTLASNYPSDAGTQVALLLVAAKEFKDFPKIKDEKDMLNYYVAINKRIEGDDGLAEEARKTLERIEGGDPMLNKELAFIRDVSMAAFQKNYELLDVQFDETVSESQFVQAGKEMVAEAIKKKIAFKADTGETVAELKEHGLPNTILLRSNGTTTYLARDLALADYRYKKYGFDATVYVTGSEQKLHFQQLFKILSLLKRPFASVLHHLPFGLISLPEGAISTRAGRVVFLEDVLAQAISAAKEEIKSARKTEYTADEINEISQIVGIGAVKFTTLRITPEKDIVFDFKKMVSFEGDTSAYIQYSYVRAKKILEKVGKPKAKSGSKGKDKEKIKTENYRFNDSEKQLLKALQGYPAILEKAAKDFQPYYVANYALELAGKFSNFYEKTPVLKAEEGELPIRMKIVELTASVLKDALWHLGIDVPEKM